MIVQMSKITETFSAAMVFAHDAFGSLAVDGIVVLAVAATFMAAPAKQAETHYETPYSNEMIVSADDLVASLGQR